MKTLVLFRWPQVRRTSTPRPRCDQRAAFRTLLCFVGMYIAAQVGFNILLETHRPDLREPEAYHRLWRLTQSPPLEPGEKLVVVLGSSRTQMAWDPSILQQSGQFRTFNLGQSAAGPVQMNLNYDRLRRTGIKPSAIIIEIMPATFAQHQPLDMILTPHVHRLGLADCVYLSPKLQSPRLFYQSWASHRIHPLYEYRHPIVSCIAPRMLDWKSRSDFQWRDLQDNGFLPYPFETIPDAERSRGLQASFRNYQQTFQDFQIAPVADQELRNLMERAQADGVRVALYRAPESAKFRSWYTPTAEARLKQYLHAIGAEYGTPYFDASTWYDTEDYFSDGHHMM
ncbi:MAG: hypothetical protein ACRCZF_04090, partial [Gemmataceae bacterium]